MTIACPSCGCLRFRLARSGNAAVCRACGKRYALPTCLEVIA